ncbi:hypothetical protein I553_8351 [Mycobacterium xenopi 4042]|uniref:Uncharacterized protein n=1 Tax=Mycobacterium xenopi 4042 TaxID=1299334 RepID=X8BIS6_MYCXE|nr:hypothetical protein I553_8351 [Mycobacterium xenopi 4042]
MPGWVALAVGDAAQAPGEVLEEEFQLVGKVVARIWIHVTTSRLDDVLRRQSNPLRQPLE